MSGPSASSHPPTEPRLEKARHVKYWTRCLKTFLPHQYTSNDSNRMYLAFFILAALDLLDALTTVSTAVERRDYVEWIYRCQHPKGGFRMWPGTDLGARANESNAKWDPANIPATYFALASLLILGDDLGRIRRRETLDWVRKMQRANGSFGETLVDEKVEGGQDPRYGYCATGIRFILRGKGDGKLKIDGQNVGDVELEGLVKCIAAAESYDGGIADEAFHEPHAGYAYCSLGALAFAGRLSSQNTSPRGKTTRGPRNREGVLTWLASRQTDVLDPDTAFDTEFISKNTTRPLTPPQPTPGSTEPQQTPSPLSSNAEFDCAGMCGRTNKVADTCYAFWVGASLHILGEPALCDRQSLCRYLLQQTQHPVLGGFGKFPGDLPDLYHSYLGLAALSLAGNEEVEELDAGMCISRKAKERILALWDGWHH